MKKIRQQRLDYVVQVKKNQSQLHHWTKFNTSIREGRPVDTDLSIDKEHGRLEKRICEVYDDTYMIKQQWPSIRSLVKVEASVKNIKTNSFSSEVRYYASSLDPHTTTAKQFKKIIRSHWQIENSCHYIKDVTFHEDLSTFRTNAAPQNMSIIRSAAINVLRLNGFTNLKQTRKKLAWGMIDIFSLIGIKK